MPEKSAQIAGQAAIAYVLKGFPRLSETFISSEIYRMEQNGLRLRLYVIKPSEERPCSSRTVQGIKARPFYLPATTSLKEAALPRWLRLHIMDFLPAMKRAFVCHPLRFTRAALGALAQAVRARRTFWSWPRKVYLKEFMQAAVIADQLRLAPDVKHLHAHFCHGATTVTWLASIISGVPFSFTAHAKDLYSPSLNPAGLLRRKMDAARFVVTCTDANREYLQQQGSATPVYCIYHGLNADFTSLLAERGAVRTANGHVRALAVGRLVRKKGFDVFVEACSLLKQRGTKFEAWIVGESGEHEQQLRTRIRELGLSQYVRLPGPMSQSELFEEYTRSTVFCLPCRVLEDGDRDGIPNVLLEAMACGVPVISTTVSGIPEAIKDRINGLLVSPEDPQALAEALLRVHGDPGVATALSTAAQKTVQQRFNAEIFAGRMAALLREAIA
ncbi:MAG TPA: glycosyltransferase [Terriglobales bacterium]|nr:glycosyltransferase [Terriglobales bacterium]